MSASVRPVLDSVRYPFGVDPEAGRLAQEPDYDEHVEQLILQVLFTSPGERINRPDFGCRAATDGVRAELGGDRPAARGHGAPGDGEVAGVGARSTG